MRVVAGFVIFLGFAFTIVSCEDTWETRPHKNGLDTRAMVVDHVEDDGYTYSVVRFTDASGEIQQSRIESEGWVPTGTILTVSYREAFPTSNVRVPELRKRGPTGIAGGILLLGAGMALWYLGSQRATQQNMHRLAGAMLREPGLLRAATQKMVDAGTAAVPVEAAFPVVRRRPMKQLLTPFVVLLVLLYVVGLLGGPESTPALLFFPLLALMLLGLLVVAAKSKNPGVVAITEKSILLFDMSNRSFEDAKLVERIDRGIPFPASSSHKGGLLGGPLPFELNKDSPEKWHYAGQIYSSGSVSFSTIIESLRRDADPTPGPDANRSALNVLEPDQYLRWTEHMHNLVPGKVFAALPVRSLTQRGDVTSQFATSRFRSLFVTANGLSVVSHRTPVRQASVELLPPSNQPIETQLSSLELRVDDAVGWAPMLASALQPSRARPEPVS